MSFLFFWFCFQNSFSQIKNTMFSSPSPFSTSYFLFFNSFETNKNWFTDFMNHRQASSPPSLWIQPVFDPHSHYAIVDVLREAKAPAFYFPFQILIFCASVFLWSNFNPVVRERNDLFTSLFTFSSLFLYVNYFRKWHRRRLLAPVALCSRKQGHRAPDFVDAWQ